ncbi:MAG: hypothetical protein DME87_11610 [Verrucomicrobia bacterium]|nr:MAG: hypothetical protein DME87_11610 [Verrucomicrobiota bacterium]
MSAIDPGSAPRNTSLNTRTGKKELAATAKRNVSRFAVAELTPLSRFRSTSIATLPLATIIFSRVPLWTSGLFCLDPATEFCELLQKSKGSGSMKAVTVLFNIVFGPPILFRLAQLRVKL